MASSYLIPITPNLYIESQHTDPGPIIRVLSLPPTGTLSTPLPIAPMWLRDVHAATVWEPQGDGHLTRQHDSYPLPGTDTIRAARAHRRRNEATSRGVAVPLRLGGGRDVSEVDRPGE
ncbi:hypothetical protein PCL_11699 [Purpureocillium lilacinum]|uniref:Uncharacterized protein n=1 Tax=Purpureocillium lilacinum TaxID=33203 RepID=A0A2U3EAT2_PURLI|nr:hypothetical protein PCL_11699 [Purpureocillium lilacinum]